MSDLEVKVGQVYVSLVTDGFYIVSGIDSKGIYLSGGGSVVTVPYKNLHKAFQLVKESPEEDKKDDTTSLRDHLAGLAMQGMISKYGNQDGEFISRNAYHIADAMLKERGE